MDGQQIAIAFGKYSKDGTSKVEGCKIERVIDPDGQVRPGEYEIRLPPGTGAHSVEIQLAGPEPRRYTLENIDPQTHQLRTYRHLDVPSMMEDTGFEMVVSMQTIDKP